MITQKRLKEMLHYDPDTGVFTWLVNLPNGTKVGDIAGCNNFRYNLIGVDKKQYLIHRLAFLYMIGEIPKYVDHINEIKDDNRWCNLRPCNQSQNMANVVAPLSNNKSGFKGVYWEKYRCKWRADIKKNGKNHLVGRFDSPEAAHKAYKQKHVEIFGEFSPYFKQEGSP